MLVFKVQLIAHPNPSMIVVGADLISIKEYVSLRLPGFLFTSPQIVSVGDAVREIEAGAQLLYTTEVWLPELLERQPELKVLFDTFYNVTLS